MLFLTGVNLLDTTSRLLFRKTHLDKTGIGKKIKDKKCM